MVKRVIIVGGGQAGFQVATSLAQKNYEGEIILLTGEEHPPYERPPLSKAYLKGETPAERLLFRPPGFYSDRGIDLRTGTWVREIERTAGEIVLEGDERLSYTALVLATGARVKRLPLPGADRAGIHYLRSLEDADRIRARLGGGVRVCVIGGGYIGLEVAAAARALGAEVTVLEAQERVMTRTASAPIAEALSARHRAEGVELRTGAEITGFSGGDGRLEAVSLAGGEHLPADFAVVGIGVAPETTLAEQAGLNADGGILVDELGRSCDPAIFAAGDCVRYAHPLAPGPVVFESVQNAVDQAKAVASAILGQPIPYTGVPWFWSDQYDVKLQTAGLFTAEDETVLRGDPASGSFSVAHLRSGRLVAVETLDRMKDFIQARKLIAAQIAPDPAVLADPETPLKTLT